MQTNPAPITPSERPSLSPARAPIAAASPAEKKSRWKKRADGTSSRPVEINISLPKLPRVPFSKLNRALKKGPRRVVLIIAGLVLLTVIGLVVLYTLDRQRKTGYTATTTTENGNKVTELNKGQPSYNTILPSGKSITDLGGWTRVSPTDRNPVFTYLDHIGKVQVRVSQQPLPDSFKEDLANQISYLAKGFHSDVKVDANGTDVYVGTSAKGPQSVIFTKNNLLILITSTSKVEIDDWVTYVTSLK